MLAERFARDVFDLIRYESYQYRQYNMSNTFFPIRQYHHEIGVLQIDSIQRTEPNYSEPNQPITIFCNVRFQDINETIVPITFNIEWNE